MLVGGVEYLARPEFDEDAEEFINILKDDKVIFVGVLGMDSRLSPKEDVEFLVDMIKD